MKGFWLAQTFVEEGLVEVDRAANMISNMKKLSLVERKATKSMVRDLAEAISEAALKVDVEFSDKNLKLELDSKPGQYSLMADEFLDDVFSALLHNAMKFDDDERTYFGSDDDYCMYFDSTEGALVFSNNC